jgi:hypothetical protein
VTKTGNLTERLFFKHSAAQKEKASALEGAYHYSCREGSLNLFFMPLAL